MVTKWVDKESRASSYPLSIVQEHPSVYCKSGQNDVMRIRFFRSSWLKKKHCDLFSSLMQDVPNRSPGMCQENLKPKSILAHWGQTIHLSCGVSKSYWAAADKPPVWYKQPAIGAMYPVALKLVNLKFFFRNRCICHVLLFLIPSSFAVSNLFLITQWMLSSYM